MYTNNNELNDAIFPNSDFILNIHNIYKNILNNFNPNSKILAILSTLIKTHTDFVMASKTQTLHLHLERGRDRGIETERGERD